MSAKRLQRVVVLLGIAYTLLTGTFAWVLRCACGPACRCSWWCSCEKFWSQWMEAWAVGTLAFAVVFVVAAKISARTPAV
ncbi:MAG TPA: hypothetical protein VLE97_07135 [Gaiellaceae bacterium]|nr:hypothetical protein [Gaiellaceae bacterium]